MLLSLKQVFHLPLRALQGFAQSLRKLAFPSLPVPNYTTLSRRAQTLKVALPAQRPHEPMHLVIDSTGLKVWRRRVEGAQAWLVQASHLRKVHLAMDANTGQICAALMTHQDEGDGEVLPDLLDQIPADVMIDTIAGDGAYDTKPCHAQIAARGASPSIPPREGAKPWPDRTPGATAQCSYCRYRRKQQARMEAGERLPPAIARRDLDVPAQGTHGLLSVGARDGLASHRGINPCGCTQSHGSPRSPAVRPYRLRLREHRSCRLYA
ncbi:IS5 family transposase [Paraburkholderia sp. A2RI-6]|uniref:IS5 family transposase n=1 Tax=Paraburkholderia sp. A2RI-6 TaxID=3028371 RepID=UPI003B7D5F5F